MAAQRHHGMPPHRTTPPYQVIMTPNVGQGLTALIQTAGLGGLYPNTVMLGWSQEWQAYPERATQMCRLLLTAAAYNQALIVIKGMEHIPDSSSHMTRPMDIWWRDTSNPNPSLAQTPAQTPTPTLALTLPPTLTLTPTPTRWMVHDGGLQLLLTTILRKGRVWSSCALRVFCVLQA